MFSVIFPGQGSQIVGMGRDLYSKHDTIKKLYNCYIDNDSIGSMLAFHATNPYGYGRVKVKNNKVLSVVEEIHTTLSDKKITLCNAGVIICNSKLLFSNINKISDKNLKKEKYLPDIFQI